MIGNPKTKAPTPGSIVELHAIDSTPPSVAIVTHVWNPELVNLTVFDPMGAQLPLNATSVAFSADGTQPHGAAHWATWPQRERELFLADRLYANEAARAEIDAA